MKKFAVLDFNSKVTNIILAPSITVAEQVSFSNCREISNDTLVSIDFTWDGTRFIPLKPYPSWILNTSTYLWEAPVAMPTDNEPYEWNEETTSWDQLPRP